MWSSILKNYNAIGCYTMISFIPKPLLTCFAAGLLLCPGFLSAGIDVSGLTCEFSVDPLGIDKEQPRLFWILDSDERGARQSAYQILVADSPDALESNEGNLWDSGRVNSGTSTHVRYAGMPLESTQQVFWKVRVWDEAGKVSAWSDPASWTMGMLNRDDWTGRWIKPPEEWESILFRKTIDIGDGLVRALAQVSGLGHYELFLNGEKVSDDLFSPGWTNYSRTVLYDTRDLTQSLQKGRNCVGLILGNGMFKVSRRGRFSKFEGSFGDKRAIIEIRLEYADGRVEVIGSDESWQTRPGPITYSNIYGGEDHDARLLDDAWCTVGADRDGWTYAVVGSESDRAKLRGHSASNEPIRPIEVRQPVEIRDLAGPGARLYDFGQNASYMPRLRVSGPAGSKVLLIPGENIFPDGYVSRASMGGIHRGTSWWTYIKSTDGEETWFPKFFYIGSRYMQSQVIPPPGGGERPVIESLEGVIVHSTARPIGNFETSNPLLNRIRELVRWAQRSNMVSVLTDCPHREKLGWLEQYHLNGPAIRYEFDMARTFTKGMRDMTDSQTDNGMVPNIAPEYLVFKGAFRTAAEWGAAFIVVPWQQYLFSGDVELIREFYPEMKQYFQFLEASAEDDILSDGLGDWFDLGPRRPPGRAQLTQAPVTATAFYFYDATLLSRMAEILGNDADADYFKKKAAAIRKQFNKRFFNKTGGYYGSNSQCANAMALYMGLVEDEQRQRVFASLLEDVEGRGFSMTAGDIGFRFLLLALSDGGADEAIYRMINQDQTPGYGYQLRMGATALTEAWDGNKVTSNNHFMLGHITEWFYGRLLGIAPDSENPGFQNIILEPRPVGDLDWVRGSYASLYGDISVEWRVELRGFRYMINVPPNTTATLHLPVDKVDSIREGGKPVARAKGIHLVGTDAQGSAILELKPGEYDFETDYKP